MEPSVISLTWISRKRQNSRYGNQINGCLELGVGRGNRVQSTQGDFEEC